MSVRINEERLVMQSCLGSIHHPTIQSTGEVKICHDGKLFVSPAVGGITYNVKIGDSVYGMDCDHVEPGVTIRNPDRSENGALVTLACIGNEAVAVSGDARGAKGIVTGFHGGIDHTIIYFKHDDLVKMLPGDRIMIKAIGQGMRLLDAPEIIPMGIDPYLCGKMNMEVKDGKMIIDVAAKIPSHLMGAGVGCDYCYNGDWDLMTADKEEIKKYNLDKLRYGDIVLLQDCDCTHGRCFRRGAVSIGIVVHSDSVIAGHGPGITTLFACDKPLIEGVISEKANLKDILDLE